MKRKELKNLAKEIAEKQRLIDSSDDQQVIATAQSDILKLSGQVFSLEDVLLLDEMIMDILN